MASLSIQVEQNYAKSADCRLLELSEPILNALYVGTPMRSPQNLGQKREREENSEGDDNASAPEFSPATRLAFTIRGNDEEVVICTHKETFSLRRHEFSNNLYLMDVNTQVIKENTNFVCEVQPTRSRTETLRTILYAEEDTFLTLEEVESWDNTIKPSRYLLNKRPHLVTFEALAERSLCSRTEIADFLTTEGALLVEGRVRLLHPALAAQVLEAIMHTVNSKMGSAIQETESGVWALDSFPESELLSHLRNIYPSAVVKSVLSRVTKHIEGGEEEIEGEKRLQFAKEKVMIELARSILDPSITNSNIGPLGTQNLTSPLNEQNKRNFLAAWRSKISMLASPTWLLATTNVTQGEATQNGGANDSVVLTDAECMALLDGLAFVNNDTNSTETAVVTWCPHWRLPMALPLRINALFSRKPRWPANELRSYITPCLDVGVTFDAAVAKYCRELRSSDKAIPSTYILA